MRIAGIVLIIAGILMFVFSEINFTTEKKVVDIGPVEINKKENKKVGWPTYAGGVVALLGVVLVIAGNKKDSIYGNEEKVSNKEKSSVEESSTEKIFVEKSSHEKIFNEKVCC